MTQNTATSTTNNDTNATSNDYFNQYKLTIISANIEDLF